MSGGLLMVHPYEDGIHRKFVDDWYAKRGLTWKMSLSPNGFFVPCIAAGWLYASDADFAFVEGVVTDPAADGESRSQALDLIQKACEDRAKELGKKRLLALISHDGLQSRSQKYGYKPLGIHLLLEKEV